MTETTTVVAVKLRYRPKPFWFDPVLGEYSVGDQVLVETERGREVGSISMTGIMATAAELQALDSPLKPVIRLLDEQDLAQVSRMQEKADAAMPLFKELIDKNGLEMKPVAVEYLFTGDKAVFYFASESRVDFRELVREMAARLHLRVELRQIGVRDEARILGGLAHCGEHLCCARMGADFQPVSIRMAKEQDLPLNPDKISGACGRLMCCLRYEFEAYRDFKSRAPKRGALINTPLGTAKVTDYDTPREIVSMQLEDGLSFSVALKDFDQATGSGGEMIPPCVVSRRALESSANAGTILALSALDSNKLVDELAQAASEPTRERRQRRASGETAQPNAERGERQNRRRAAKADSGGDAAESRPADRGKAASGESRGGAGKAAGASRAAGSDGRQSRESGRDAGRETGRDAGRETGREQSRQRLRPGQNSSGLRQRSAGSQSTSGSASGGAGSSGGGNRSNRNQPDVDIPDGRRPRRRHQSEDSTQG